MQHIFKKTLMLLFLSVFIWGTASAETISISLDKEKLTADIKNVPLKKVLQKLSDECGASVYIDESIPEKNVTVKFKNIPVEEAVKRLVAPYSSAVIFSKEKGKKVLRVSSIKVFQEGKSKEYVEVKSSPKVPEVKTDSAKKSKYSKEEIEKTRERIPHPGVKKIYDMLTEAAQEIEVLKKDISEFETSLATAETEEAKGEIREEISKKREAIEALEEAVKKQVGVQADIIRAEQKAKE